MLRCIPSPLAQVETARKRHRIVDHDDLLVLGCVHRVLVVARAVALGNDLAQQQILHVLGHSWESGGFPPSDVGDQLSVLFTVTAIEEPLVWDTSNYSYTLHIFDLVALGETVFGTTRVAQYSGGGMTDSS